MIASACVLALGATSLAHAQSNQELKQQIELLQKQIDMLRQRLDAAPPAAAAAPAGAPAAGGEFLTRKTGKGVTFLTHGGEVSVYGNLDLSLDDTTKGIGGMVAPDGSTPVGNSGWMPAISSNSSYVGLRGFQSIGALPARFVWQLETQIDVSATSGYSQTNSNQSSSVKGALTSRNSFIGLANSSWGAVKIGKTDTPYKTSTNALNPFSGMLGDYAVIMGNSGGDNRVEFGSRLDHSIWYESPAWNGLAFNALFSPGQNRSNDSSNLASGEGDCTGGNIPGSGGGPVACNDGAFSNAYSFSLNWRRGPLYLTGAYELHKKVNRTGDLPAWDAGDVADENAMKVGAQYRFGGTTVGGIFERLRRDVPDRLAFQNERSRNGFWFTLSQNLGFGNSVHFGWAHAGKTPGDPGTHNTAGGANPDNEANMFTLAWKHQVDPNLSYYVDYATTINHRDAHFDLGAGGRSVTTDCHDASNPDTSGFDPNGNAPKCWAGGHLQGVSVGMRYQF
jgi:predicted porin